MTDVTKNKDESSNNINENSILNLLSDEQQNNGVEKQDASAKKPSPDENNGTNLKNTTNKQSIFNWLWRNKTEKKAAQKTEIISIIQHEINELKEREEEAAKVIEQNKKQENEALIKAAVDQAREQFKLELETNKKDEASKAAQVQAQLLKEKAELSWYSASFVLMATEELLKDRKSMMAAFIIFVLTTILLLILTAGVATNPALALAFAPIIPAGLVAVTAVTALIVGFTGSWSLTSCASSFYPEKAANASKGDALLASIMTTPGSQGASSINNLN